MARWIYGLLLLGWMGVIFYFSSQPFERQNMRPWLRRFWHAETLERHWSWVRLRYGGHPVSVEALGPYGFAEFMLRKAAHVTEYAVLGGLLCLLLRAFVRRRWLAASSAALLCFAYAATDEYHQSFVHDRTPLAADVLLDTGGACAGILLVLLMIAAAGRVFRGGSGAGAPKKEMLR